MQTIRCDARSRIRDLLTRDTGEVFLMKGRASEGLRTGNAIEVGIEVG
jgi:hypothetical protein